MYAICDIQRALLFQKKYGVDHVTDDYRECVSSNEVDIVIIATRPKSHLEILQACISIKKNMYSAKNRFVIPWNPVVPSWNLSKSIQKSKY